MFALLVDTTIIVLSVVALLVFANPLSLFLLASRIPFPRWHSAVKNIPSVTTMDAEEEEMPLVASETLNVA